MNLRIRKSAWLTLALTMILVFSIGALGQARELLLWYGGDLVEQTPTAEKQRNFWETRWSEELGLDVSKDYGPPVYPEMKQKFLIQGRNGRPDIVRGVLSNISTYAAAGLIAPLEDRFNAWDESQNYYKNIMDAVTFKGHLWALPVETNARVLLYRKDIFEKYGLSVPKTWDELVKTASFISEHEPDMAGLMLTTKKGDVRAFQEFISWYYQLNDHFFKWDEASQSWTLAATKGQLVKVLNLYWSVINGTKVPAMDPNERGADYKLTDYGYTSGKYAMVPMGPWIWKHQFQSEERANIIMNTGVAPLPVAEGGKPGTYLEVESIMLNAHSRSIDDAWKLMQSIVDQKSSTFLLNEMAALPARSDVEVDTSTALGQWLEGFAAQLGAARALAPVNWEPTRNDILQAMQQVLYNESTPEEAAAWLYDAVQKRIDSGQV